MHLNGKLAFDYPELEGALEGMVVFLDAEGIESIEALGAPKYE